MIAQKQKEHTIEKTYKELYIEILKVNKEIGLRFQDYISTHLSKISQISSDVLNEDKFNQVDTTIGNCIKDIREIGDSVVEKCIGYEKQSNRMKLLNEFSDFYLNYFQYKKEEINRSIKEINNLIRKNTVRQKKKIYSADDVRAKFSELKFSNNKSYNPKLFSLYLEIDKMKQFLLNDMNSKRQIIFDSKRIQNEFRAIAERNMKYLSTLQQLSKYSSKEYITKKNNIYKEIFVSFMKLFESLYISLEQKYQNEYNKLIDKNKKKTITISTQGQMRNTKKDTSIYSKIDQYLQFIKPSKTFSSNQECIDIEDIFDDNKYTNNGKYFSFLKKKYESDMMNIEKLSDNIKLFEKETKDIDHYRTKIKNIIKELYDQIIKNEDDFTALVEELPSNLQFNSSYSQDTKTSETSELNAFLLFNGKLDELTPYISDKPQISFIPDRKEKDTKSLTKSLYSNSPVKFDQIPRVNEIIDNQVKEHENASKKRQAYPNRPIIQKYDEVQLEEGDIIVRNTNNSNQYLLPSKEIIDKVNAANRKKDKKKNTSSVEIINPFKDIIISQPSIASPKKEDSVQSEGEVKEPKKENNDNGFIFTDTNNPFKVVSEKKKKFDHPPLGDIGKKFFEEIAQQNEQGQKIQLINESAPNEKLLPQDTLQFSDHKDNTLEETKNIKPTDSILLPPVSKDSVYVYK